jgi:hypothetical protein
VTAQHTPARPPPTTARSHEGTTAGLDFEGYGARVRDVTKWVNEKRRRSHAAFNKLLEKKLFN